MSEEAKPVRWWNRALSPTWLCVLLLGCLFLLLVLMLPYGPAFFQIFWAAMAGWLLHGLRVLPVFADKWQAVIIPLSMVIVAWWMGHGFLRWYFQSSGSRLAGRWTFRRSGALLALVLLGAAAAVSISGVAHQAMWLGQTKWTENRRGGSPAAMTAMSTRNLGQIMIFHDSETGRLPATMDELWKFVVENDVILPASILTSYDGKLYVPMLTSPGAVIAELPPNKVILFSNPVAGMHHAYLASGALIRITPQELDEIIARGDWIYREKP